ncbi:MAG: hypothetical protein M9900_13070 [Flavobacteriales bacterium]|nr:hypothetical protein [Flavobacteriales bacterium]
MRRQLNAVTKRAKTMSEDAHTDGVYPARNIGTAATLVLLGANRAMTAEAIADRLRIEGSTDDPCSASDVLAWANQKGYLNEQGKIWFSGLNEALVLRNDFRGALFWSNWSRSFGYQRLAAAAVLSISRFLQTHPDHPSTDSMRQLLMAGLHHESLAQLLRTIGEIAGAPNLPERLGIAAWSELRIRDLGRLISALSPGVGFTGEHSFSIGDEWWQFAHAKKVEGRRAITLKKEISSLRLTTDEFPYDHWIQLRAPGREFFFPDAQFAAPAFLHHRSLVLRDIRVTGYCADADERDGLRLMLSAQGIEHDLHVRNGQGAIPLPSTPGTSVVTCPVDAKKALLYAKEFLRTATQPGHRRLFLIAPIACFHEINAEWDKVRREMVERDLLDCMLTLPQVGKQMSDLGMFVLDNNKWEDAKGLVLFGGGTNNMNITNPDDPIVRKLDGLKTFAFRMSLQMAARDRKGACTLITNDIILTDPNCRLAIAYCYHPFSVISSSFPWEELKQFKEVGSIMDFSIGVTVDANGDITREGVIKALRKDMALPEYVRHELAERYMEQQMEKIRTYKPQWGYPDAYIRIPSIEAQLRKVEGLKRSWGLLPMSETEGVSDDWVANVVDNILLRNEDPEQCKLNLGYIIRELQRVERTRALADAEEAYKAYRHDLGNMTGRVRDSISLLKGQMKKPDAWTALATDTHGRLEGTLSTLDHYFEKMKGLLTDQEKCFTNEHYSLTAVELSDVLNNVIGGFKDPDVRLEYRGGPAQVWADRQKLEQLITNLVLNAIGHGKVAGRELCIVLDRMDEWDQDWGEPGSIPLFIGNNGKAFEQSFDELTKQGRRSKQSKGEGLGLYLARKWAKGMGGELEMANGTFPAIDDISPPLSVGFFLHLRQVE